MRYSVPHNLDEAAERFWDTSLFGIDSWQQVGHDVLALLERRTPEVFAVKRDQVEGAEDGGMILLPVAEQIENREPVAVHDDRFAVDYA